MELAAPRLDAELVETFFNSASRRIFHTVGVDDRDRVRPPRSRAAPRGGRGALPRLVRRTARPRGRRAGARSWRIPSPPGGRISRATPPSRRDALERILGEAWGAPGFDALDLLRPVFFRSKGAYLVGRVRRDGRQTARRLRAPEPHGARRGGRRPLRRGRGLDRLQLHALLLPRGRRASRPRSSAFLKTLMPKKPVGELYNALGFDKHGKTELYRDLLRHLASSDDRFVEAPGARGMVMLVFTLPSYDVVFKVIRDSFAPAEDREPQGRPRQVPARLPAHARRPARGRAGVRASVVPGGPLRPGAPRRAPLGSLGDRRGAGRRGRPPSPLHGAPPDAARPLRCRTRRRNGRAPRSSTSARRSATSRRRTSSRATSCRRTSASRVTAASSSTTTTRSTS